MPCPICGACVCGQLVDGKKQFEEAVVNYLDIWVPASGGTERPFRSRAGVRMQYLFNPHLGEHAYFNLDTDMKMSNEEAMAALQI